MAKICVGITNYRYYNSCHPVTFHWVFHTNCRCLKTWKVRLPRVSPRATPCRGPFPTPGCWAGNGDYNMASRVRRRQVTHETNGGTLNFPNILHSPLKVYIWYNSGIRRFQGLISWTRKRQWAGLERWNFVSVLRWKKLNTHNQTIVLKQSKICVIIFG